MATSDSEDFESADEWDDGSDAVSEKMGMNNVSVKACIGDNSISDAKSRAIVSGNDDSADVEKVAKSMEKDVKIQETKSTKNYVCMQERQSDIKVFSNTSKLSEGDDVKVPEIFTEIDDKRVNHEEVTISKLQAESDVTTIVDDKRVEFSDTHVQKLTKEDMEKISETCAKKADDSVDVQCAKKTEDKENTLIVLDHESVEVHSKEENSNLNIAGSLDPETETDGWDCEDNDLNEQVFEESINKDPVSALNNLSESDDKEKKNSDSSTSNTWSSWGSWGVTSILSTATESVSTLTSHVSQGLSTVLETGLGVPDPEELAKQKAEEERKILSSVESDSTMEVEEHEEKSDGNSGLFGFGRVISGVSSITKLVETAGTKVVSGGLGTLETIGKKTMEVLQEGDPGLRKKRALFSDKVVLSQVLREAKEKAELEDKAVRNTQEARKVHFEMLFDDYHGLVHLEALEMLSKQCNIKLQSVLLNTTPSDVPELQESMAEIKDLCQLPDDDDEVEGISFETLETRLGEVGKGLGVPVANEKLVKTWQEIHQWLQECRNKQMFSKKEAGDNEDKPPTAREIHQKAIGTLAKLTAEAVEQFHKTAELLLVYEKRNPFQEAKILLEMTSVFSLEVSTAATVFSENLNTCSEYSENREAVNSDITNVFLEAANSSSYIQEAFQLLIPVLQVGAVSL